MPEWDDEQVDDIVMGSGAEVWPWYLDGIGQVMIAPGKYGDYTVELGLDRDEVTVARFSRDDFRRVAREVAEGKHAVNQRIVDYILNDDLDADAVDVVIQVIALGEVVYG